MSGTSIITTLTLVFGLITIGAVIAVLARFRRRPIVWMLRAAERRAAFHRDAIIALEAAVAAARDEHSAGLGPLAASLQSHRRALHNLGETFPEQTRRVTGTARV